MTIGPRKNTASVEMAMCRYLAVIAVQRRIEEERRRKGWATAGYRYVHQQAEETVAQTRTQEAMEAVRTRFCCGGVTRKREEQEVGAKDLPPKRARTVEEPTYLPPVPATALVPGHLGISSTCWAPQAVRDPDT